jgi:hypothetical protein
LAYRDLHRLLILPHAPDVFYLAAGEGLYRSDDGGEGWEQLTRRGDKLGYPDFLYLDPTDKDAFYMGGSFKNPDYWRKVDMAESSIMRSEDLGHSWIDLDKGLPKPVIGAFEAMGLHQWPGGFMMTLGTATGEVYASENRGESWTLIADGVGPVAKDDHHIFFLPPGERDAARAKPPV